MKNPNKGIVELDLGQNEYKSAAIWEKKIALDLLKKGPADDGEKLQITDLLQKSAQHHQKANCEQLAAAIYLNAAEKLADSSSAPYYDQFLTEPKLKENNQIQLRSFVEKAANLRNDETSGMISFYGILGFISVKSSSLAYKSRLLCASLSRTCEKILPAR